MDRRYEQFNEMTFEAYIKSAIDKAVLKANKKQIERAVWEQSLSTVTDADLYSVSQKDIEIEQVSRVFRVHEQDIPIFEEKLGHALSLLLPKDREVILMYYFLKMTDEKMSHILNISRSAVQQRRSGAMKKLHILLEDNT